MFDAVAIWDKQSEPGYVEFERTNLEEISFQLKCQLGWNQGWNNVENPCDAGPLV